MSNIVEEGNTFKILPKPKKKKSKAQKELDQYRKTGIAYQDPKDKNLDPS